MVNVYVDSTERAQSKIQGNIWGTGVVPNPEFVEPQNTQESIVFEPENRSARKQTTPPVASKNSQSSQKSQRGPTSGESQKSNGSQNGEHQSNSQSQPGSRNRKEQASTSRAYFSGESQRLSGSRNRDHRSNSQSQGPVLNSSRASSSGESQKLSGSRNREEKASTSGSRSSGSRNSRDHQSSQSHRSKPVVSQHSDSGLYTQDPFYGSQSSVASSQLSVGSTQQSRNRVASSTQIIRKPAEKSKTHHSSSREKESCGDSRDSKRKALEGAFGTNNVFKNVTINMHFHYHGE